MDSAIRGRPEGRRTAKTLERNELERSSYPVIVAEGEGFEPSNAYALLVFKTSAIGLSATPPAVVLKVDSEIYLP